MIEGGKTIISKAVKHKNSSVDNEPTSIIYLFLGKT